MTVSPTARRVGVACAAGRWLSADLGEAVGRMLLVAGAPVTAPNPSKVAAENGDVFWRWRMQGGPARPTGQRGFSTAPESSLLRGLCGSKGGRIPRRRQTAAAEAALLPPPLPAPSKATAAVFG